MHTKKRAWVTILLLVAAIKIFSLFPAAVEQYYSNGFYPVISGLLRFLFGWLPFSVGDILYAVTAVYLIVHLVIALRLIFKKQAGRFFWWNSLRRLAFYSLLVYVVFNVCWGLNYNRLGTAYQMQLQLKTYSTEELATVMAVVVDRLDSTNTKAFAGRRAYSSKKMLFHEAANSYRAAEKKYTQLSYSIRSVKPSLFSYLGDYLGYTGYYNPFTGEAQVNTTVPVFVQPFTTCHEMGHQLGYAKENEANFAGYLSGKSSLDPLFRYSVYFDLYNYGIRELFGRDSLLAIALNSRKPVQVKKDNLALQAFYARFENPVEPYIKTLYGQYLRANEQPSGMLSYNEVMAFMVAYYKKYGAAAL
ncbi:MAG: DUF3810 domain-containing protein [Chitinophagaceae bacterium]